MCNKHDRFHVAKLENEALQQIWIKLQRKAIEEENAAIKQATKGRKIYSHDFGKRKYSQAIIRQNETRIREKTVSVDTITKYKNKFDIQPVSRNEKGIQPYSGVEKRIQIKLLH